MGTWNQWTMYKDGRKFVWADNREEYWDNHEDNEQYWAEQGSFCNNLHMLEDVEY